MTLKEEATMAIGQWLQRFLVALATVFALGGPWPATAQWKPTVDVEFVIPFGLGGGADLLARVVAKIMTEEKLVPTAVVAVNKPGGGSATGVGYVNASKRGDPHTLVLINPQTQITPLRVKDAKGWRDLTPLANFMLDDYLLFVRAASPYKTAAEMVAAAKTKAPRSVSVASAGTADDMAIAVFEAAADIKLNIIRFNSGGEVLTALLGGHVDMGAGNPLEVMGQLQSKSVRALGVYRPTRFAALPDVATMKEQGIDTVPFQMWRGVAMPPGVPAEAVRYWQDVMMKIAASKTFKDYISVNVATEHVLAGDQFAAFLERQEALYKDMLDRLGQLK
ncbi:MAG: Bug family tripartite tricarboxylate transporter substrate binding protein [Pseudomonadota bacterium]